MMRKPCSAPLAMIVVLAMMLIACTSPSGSYEEAVVLDRTDSLLEANPDSMLRLLESINYNSLTLEEQVHYDIMSCLSKAQIYHEKEMFREEAELLRKANTLQRKHVRLMYTARKYEIQEANDKAELSKRHYMQIVIMFMVIFLLLAATLFGVFLYRKKGSRQRLSKIKQEAMATERIHRLEASRQQYEQKTEEYRHQMEASLAQLSDNMNESLLQGKIVYDSILSDRKCSQLTKKREQDFVQYYRVSHHQHFSQLTAPYKELPLRLTTYLILDDMGLSPKEIENVLCVSASSVKAYKHRLKTDFASVAG